MSKQNLYKLWKQEEDIAHIQGWDFSHIAGRCDEGNDLPWDYKDLIKSHLSDSMSIMDYDTGGGEFLLSLNHPYERTSSTEGYGPNVELCKKRLLPLGINFKECSNPENIPFEDASFDLMLNRHGDMVPKEIYRLLKDGGIFITEQVGCDNDRDLVEMVMPGTPKPFPEADLKIQKENFQKNGFQIIMAEEVFRPIIFYDVGAFVWFARIIEWEFPDFSVDKHFEKLLEMQRKLEKYGKIQGTTHRFLLVAKK